MGIPQWLRGMYQEGRERRHWSSIEDMARELNFRTPTLNRWMTGRRRPDALSCIRLARSTGTPVETVLTMAGYGEETRDLLTVNS